MSSDADYASFLERANQPTSDPTASAPNQSSKNYGTKSVDGEVPPQLKELDAWYTSDSDEKFEGLSLAWEDRWEIGAEELSKLLDGKDVTQEDLGKFEKGYADVVEKVRAVSDGEVRVFRVGLGGVRSEIWVVGVRKGRVVGVKALSVES